MTYLDAARLERILQDHACRCQSDPDRTHQDCIREARQELDPMPPGLPDRVLERLAGADDE